MAAVIGWLVGLVAFVFAGYPLLMLAAARLAPQRRGTLGLPPESISILICAHNEEARLGEKLASVLDALARWPGSAEILVADDGSTDRTAEIARRFEGVDLLCLPRGGKAAALNRLAATARGDILVFSDADPLFDHATLPELLAPFVDGDVGAVAGRVETIRTGKARGGRFAAADALFRTYESALRAAEDRLFGCVSADGGLFAIRAALMVPVPPDVTDDFWISTAAVAAGRRIAFAPEARVHEHSIAGDRRQLRRRIRITVRGMTGLWRRRALMNPFRTGFYAPALVMHKLARRLAPLLIVPVWLLSGWQALTEGWPWLLLLLALTAPFLVLATSLASPVKLPRPLLIGYGATLHLVGLGAGVLLFLCGRRYAQWTPQKEAA